MEITPTTRLADLPTDEDTELNIFEYVTVMTNEDQAMMTSLGLDKFGGTKDLAEHLIHFSLHTNDHHLFTLEFNDEGIMEVTWPKYPISFYSGFLTEVLMMLIGMPVDLQRY